MIRNILENPSILSLPVVCARTKRQEGIAEYIPEACLHPLSEKSHIINIFHRQCLSHDMLSAIFYAPRNATQISISRWSVPSSKRHIHALTSRYITRSNTTLTLALTLTLTLYTCNPPTLILTHVKSTVFPGAPPILPSRANLAWALSALLLRRLFAYSLGPLVSVPGLVTLSPGPTLLAFVLAGMGGGGGTA